MDRLKASVGEGGVNQADDVRLVQTLLARHAHWLDTAGVPAPTGLCDAGTIRAIRAFQLGGAALAKADGVISPTGYGFEALSKPFIPEPRHKVFRRMCWAHPPGLVAKDYEDAARGLVPPAQPGEARAAFEGRVAAMTAAILAVRDVETSGADPWDLMGRPTILFERHLFHKYTAGLYDRSHPDISNPKPGGYARNSDENYKRLYRAATLGESAALKSASWGRFQIMGFNFAEAGFGSVEAFVDGMMESEQRQLQAFVAFVRARGCVPAMIAQDWKRFASLYNGKNYAALAAKQHRTPYDVLLERAFNRHAPAPARPAGAAPARQP